jgi:sugar phosphate isomerase/epimerase
MATVRPYTVNTYAFTLTATAEACVDTLASWQAPGIELMMYPGHAWPAEMEASRRTALRRRAADASIKVVSLNMPNIDINIAAAAPAMRAYSLDLLCDILRLAADLGATGVVIGPGKANPLMPAPAATLLGHFHAGLDRLVPLAGQLGVHLLVENMPFAWLPDAAGLMAAIAGYPADVVRVCYDLANAHFINEAPATGFPVVAPRLALVHLSDTCRDVYRHAPVGTGDVPFALGAAAARAVGYTGPVALEVIADDPATIPASASALAPSGWAAIAG